MLCVIYIYRYESTYIWWYMYTTIRTSVCTYTYKYREKCCHHKLSQFASIQIRWAVASHVVQWPTLVRSHVPRFSKLLIKDVWLILSEIHRIGADLQPEPHRRNDFTHRFWHDVAAGVVDPVASEYGEAIGYLQVRVHVGGDRTRGIFIFRVSETGARTVNFIL